MKEFQFEILPDGSMGARYYFEVRGNVPAQPVQPGATLLRVPVNGKETNEELNLLMEARSRPEKVEIENGRIRAKERPR